jgi:hypothetical protein
LKELEQIESAFFIPINAHPLKKVNELNPGEVMSEADPKGSSSTWQ